MQIRLKWKAFIAAFLFSTAPVTLAQADPPKQLRIAVIIGNGPESAWDGTFLEALERVKKAKPHDLTITTKVSDPLWGNDVESAMRLYAQSGQFDIIWGHSTYSDQIAQLKDEFPDLMFVMTGSGNAPLGGNVYWNYKRVHEPAYLLGVLAGHATTSGVVGSVGTLPADDVNDEINAFFAGARSVNPGIVTKVAFIQSWYDPAKAAEYMNSQIAAGVDVMFSLVDNFSPCDEHKETVVCIGNFRDDWQRSPRILSAPLALWDPDIERLVDVWYDHEANGTPYAGNTQMLWSTMAEGGAAVASFHGRESLVPAKAIAAFEAAKAAYDAGKLQIPLDVSLPVSK
ncbi:BMP family lipoprotein [Zavarzinia aquatilis]|uniref:BMP family ABC transporter substrate-binding protein n=1 Tax=Zavarzinia aquatilis TaxID=2211142 RepID=A0A317EEG4_9PROT|nr:BMP family protein [Zavarzinia aquatilis]PWR25309.1 BMP family ABC transporter substrate-binding protein [Zavarzinia aquatilis]